MNSDIKSRINESIYIEMIRDKYDEYEYNYELFVKYIRSVEKYLNGISIEEICVVFPPKIKEPTIQKETDEKGEIIEGEDYLVETTDPRPLYEIVTNKGWITNISEENILNSFCVKGLLNKNLSLETNVSKEVYQNSLHILGRCNNPNNWGLNKQGMVVGMVQSGKTVSMLSLTSMAISSGYNLIIYLTGSKESLRIQTQERIREAFSLRSGSYINDTYNISIFSPTYNSGYNDIQANGTHTLLLKDSNKVIIITILKEISNLKKLNQDLNDVKDFCLYEQISYENMYRALILDDEADNAGLDVAKDSSLRGINEQLVYLRELITKNCYVGYTATPQGCLGANLENKVGYPKDFIWLLEPTKEPYKQRNNLSYLGLNEFFIEYDKYLLKSLPIDAWPQHIKDEFGKKTGIYDPISKQILNSNEGDLKSLENKLADFLLQNPENIPSEFHDAIIYFLLGASIRWLRYYIKSGQETLPKKREIIDDYPYHAMMFNLSLTKINHDKTRKVISKGWITVTKIIDEWLKGNNSRFEYILDQQLKKTKELQVDEKTLDIEKISHFLKIACEIVEDPIYGETHEYIYMLNSSDEGNSLNYHDIDKRKKTKKCAIFLGGTILSRGLTIENLSVSVFIRTQATPLGDTTLQMCRWFGHKKKDIDIIHLYLTDGVRTIFKDIARCDDALRRSIRNSISENKTPNEVLIELWSSNYFSLTSPRKMRHLTRQKNSSISYSGKTFYLKQPFCRRDLNILQQNKMNFELFLDTLEYESKFEKWHERGELYKNVNPHNLIDFFKNKFNIDSDTLNISPSNYAQFIEDWVNGHSENIIKNPLPKINIGILGEINKRQRHFDVRPENKEEAKIYYKDMISSLLGGKRTSKNDPYLGDIYYDKSKNWHKANDDDTPTKHRNSADDILILFYRLNPNYLIKINQEIVELSQNDNGYLNIDYIITFAANTPTGGPNYKVFTNELVNPV